MFKKILSIILSLILIIIFTSNIIVNAAVSTIIFTNTYRVQNLPTYKLDAMTYMYYNCYNQDYDADIKIRVVTQYNTIYNNRYYYYQAIFCCKNDDYQIKKYNGTFYIFMSDYVGEQKNFFQDISSYSVGSAGGSNKISYTNQKVCFKFNQETGLSLYALNVSSNINSVDEYIVADLSSNISYSQNNYPYLLECTSNVALNAETFQNQSDIENPKYFGITLVDKQKFIDWIITNQKYLVFSDYGISNLSSTVDDIINLWEEYNSSPLKFFLSIPSFLIQNGSIFSSYEKAKELFNLLDSLYQEFKLSQNQKIFEVGTNNNLLPHQRINPQTEDPIYMENIDDTLDVKLLREILKTLIQTPNYIYTLFDYYLFNISSNVSLIADYIGQIPTYMTELLYYRFAPLFSDSGSDTSELQDFLLYLFNPTYDSFDEIDLVLKDKFDLTELEQFLLLEENLNQNLLNENDTELITLSNVGEGGEQPSQSYYPSFAFNLPVSNLTKVPLNIKLIDFDKFSIEIQSY